MVLSLVLPLLASASADAQTPVTGFVPPYEIVRTVRAAGFDPLAPPLREGTTYVLRAMDFRGILMRVVVDAHTGAIRDANRIVPGPGFYGAGGYVPGSYGPGDYGRGGYGQGAYNPPGYGPDGYGPRIYGPDGASRAYGPDTSRPPVTPPPPSSGEASADATPLSAETPSSRIGAPSAAPAEVDALGEPPQQQSARTPIGPPLPRPRPARLATQSVSNGKSADTGLAGGRPARPAVATTAPPLKSPSIKPGKASSLGDQRLKSAPVNRGA
jgi:hypothetical protein